MKISIKATKNNNSSKQTFPKILKKRKIEFGNKELQKRIPY